MSRNTKKQQVVARRKRVGKILLEEARKSEAIRLLLARALLRPEPFFPPIPNLPVNELVAALRVASLAPSDLGRFPTGSTHREWYDYTRSLTLSCLSKRLLMPRDVQKARRVLRAFDPLLPRQIASQARADLDLLEAKYEQRILPLKNALKDERARSEAAAALREMRGSGRPRRRGGKPVTPRGGRAIGEFQQRIVAVFMMLKDCGEKNPARTIATLLEDHQVSTRPSKVIRTVATYEAAANSRVRTDAFVLSKNLPETWLENLGWFFDHWLASRRRGAPTKTRAPLRKLLELFVPEFLVGASAAVVSPPWRSPAGGPPAMQSFLLGGGRFV